MVTKRKYNPVKESRDWYFVEYRPPFDGDKFATLQLIILDDSPESKVVQAMEQELKNWLCRFPIPIMVSAFDNKGDLYEVKNITACNHLIGFFGQDGNISLHWKLLKDEEIPNIALDQEYIDELFKKLTYKTNVELGAESIKKRKQIRIGWTIFFIWLVIIPAIIAFLEYFSDFLAIIVLIYSLFKAIQKGLELTGKWPKSKRDKDKELEKQLKDHYYYHCQLNPEGFKRLKLENLEKLEKEKILREAESLKSES